ncbi:hypothetical protein COE51_18140 [Bacillus pseudomycoides]|nr:hypothetical protein COE51_18140 [Bacillus pseudomycoides]
MTNPNLVTNGGFEQPLAAPQTPPPFWSGSGSTETGGTQLLGNNNAVLDLGENISQTISPLVVGETYTFQAALSTGAGAGTIDIDITGNSTRKFQSAKITGAYAMYNFDFVATSTSTTLTITNNSTTAATTLKVDVVSVKLA